MEIDLKIENKSTLFQTLLTKSITSHWIFYLSCESEIKKDSII